jgi:hypothetical protein
MARADHIARQTATDLTGDIPGFRLARPASTATMTL